MLRDTRRELDDVSRQASDCRRPRHAGPCRVIGSFVAELGPSARAQARRHRAGGSFGMRASTEALLAIRTVARHLDDLAHRSSLSTAWCAVCWVQRHRQSIRHHRSSPAHTPSRPPPYGGERGATRAGMMPADHPAQMRHSARPGSRVQPGKILDETDEKTDVRRGRAKSRRSIYSWMLGALATPFRVELVMATVARRRGDARRAFSSTDTLRGHEVLRTRKTSPLGLGRGDRVFAMRASTKESWI